MICNHCGGVRNGFEPPCPVCSVPDHKARADKAEARALAVLKAYAAVWALVDTLVAEGRQLTDGEAEWLYTCQPADAWEPLRAAGLEPVCKATERK